MKKIFRGVGTAVITPFSEDKSVNYKEFARIIEGQLAAGIAAIVVGGTTGEGSTLTAEEHAGLVAVARHTVRGNIPVIGSACSNNTAHAALLASNAKKAGADAVLAITPYYNKTSPQGLAEHFRAVSEACALPVIVYNVPSRTGMSVEPNTYRMLAEIENVAAVKEADGSLSRAVRSIALCKSSLDFYCGNDDIVVPFMSLGALGVISVVSNAFPKLMVKMIEDSEGCPAAAAREQLRLSRLCDALFCEVNPIPIKYAMSRLGYDAYRYRLPLVPPSLESIALIDERLREFT